jgi:hypothetical protein
MLCYSESKDLKLKCWLKIMKYVMILTALPLVSVIIVFFIGFYMDTTCTIYENDRIKLSSIELCEVTYIKFTEFPDRSPPHAEVFGRFITSNTTEPCTFGKICYKSSDIQKCVAKDYTLFNIFNCSVYKQKKECNLLGTHVECEKTTNLYLPMLYILLILLIELIITMIGSMLIMIYNCFRVKKINYLSRQMTLNSV